MRGYSRECPICHRSVAVHLGVGDLSLYIEHITRHAKRLSTENRRLKVALRGEVK